MEEDVKTKAVKVKPKIGVDKHILEVAINQTDMEKQLIVHCFLKSSPDVMFIRI